MHFIAPDSVANATHRLPALDRRGVTAPPTTVSENCFELIPVENKITREIGNFARVDLRFGAIESELTIKYWSANASLVCHPDRDAADVPVALGPKPTFDEPATGVRWPHTPRLRIELRADRAALDGGGETEGIRPCSVENYVSISILSVTFVVAVTYRERFRERAAQHPHPHKLCIGEAYGTPASCTHTNYAFVRLAAHSWC